MTIEYIKYKIIYRCGCQIEVYLTSDEVDTFREQARTMDCYNCRIS